MDALPNESMRTQQRAALLGDKGDNFPIWAEWAKKPAQKAVLDKLAEVTKEEDRLKAFGFAQPYGTEGVSVEMISENVVHGPW
jgi:hypothetical protein